MPSARISKTRELQKVYRLGKTVHAASLVIKFMSTPKAEHSRATIVVSKKVSKRAVIRNRIRRVLREELRVNLFAKMPIGDYVINIKPQAATLEAPALREELGKSVQRIRI